MPQSRERHTFQSFSLPNPLRKLYNTNSIPSYTFPATWNHKIREHVHFHPPSFFLFVYCRFWVYFFSQTGHFYHELFFMHLFYDFNRVFVSHLFIHSSPHFRKDYLKMNNPLSFFFISPCLFFYNKRVRQYRLCILLLIYCNLKHS